MKLSRLKENLSTYMDDSECSGVIISNKSGKTEFICIRVDEKIILENGKEGSKTAFIKIFDYRDLEGEGNKQ